jgi:O-antigen/teichoic acid export membrane protein
VNARQILSGLGWSTLATLVSAACQLVFMALLARLLEPAAFGLMAMAAVALRFAGYFSQLGFAQVLIQRPTLEAVDTTAALAMAASLGVAFAAAMALASPLVAAAFRAPELAPIVAVLGLSLLLAPLASLPLALLRREGRFKRLNAIEVLAYVVGYGGVGVLCASRGLGVWSLVAATLAQQSLLLVLGFAARRYPLCWPVPRDAVARLFAIGSRYSLIGFVEFLAGNVETLIVGRLSGKASLGLLNRAATLTNLPVELGVSAVNKVLFPALSGLQHDRQRLADGFQVLLLGVGLFSTALASGIAAGSADVVPLLLGQKWSGIVPLATILALAVPPTFMFVACGVTLDAVAALGPKLRLQTGVLALRIALVLALLRWDLPGVAFAVVATECVRLALGLRLVSRALEIAPAALGRLMLLFVAVGAGVGSAVAATQAATTVAGVPLPARVALESLAGAAALAAALLLLALRGAHYGPIQRSEAARRWHLRLVAVLRPQAVLP